MRGDAAGAVRADVSEDAARDWGGGGRNLRRTHDLCRVGFADWSGDRSGARPSVHSRGSESRGAVLPRAQGSVASGFVSHARGDSIRNVQRARICDRGVEQRTVPEAGGGGEVSSTSGGLRDSAEPAGGGRYRWGHRGKRILPRRRAGSLSWSGRTVL